MNVLSILYVGSFLLLGIAFAFLVDSRVVVALVLIAATSLAEVAARSSFQYQARVRAWSAALVLGALAAFVYRHWAG